MQLWTPEHTRTLLPAVIVMAVLGALLRLWLGKKDDRIRMLPFQILACVLAVLELGKQALSLAEGYDLYCLPFHFCSLFIFVLPITAFYKGKHTQTLRCLSAALSASVTLLMLIYPNLIYSADNIREFFTNYFSFHTVAFHNLVVLAFVLMVALGLHTPAPKGEQKSIVVFMLCFCAVSASMAHLLQTNFNNFYTCNIPPLETLRQTVAAALGTGITQLLYVLIVTALDVGFVLLSYWSYRLLRRVCGRKPR